ncbi:tRNA (cytidine(34)-2'-O)-methyltransferase [Corynebacterium kutscheri]
MTFLPADQRSLFSPTVPQDAIMHVIFHQPVIPGNTGSAIRLCAGTGAHLHLVGPLGFNFEDRQVKRAGLDYHELAKVSVHENLTQCLADIPGRLFAFTTKATTYHSNIEYQPGDAFLFGTEPTGLDEDTLKHPRITELVRIPMLKGRRSMNLANAASVATYEAWRQLGYAGA